MSEKEKKNTGISHQYLQLCLFVSTFVPSKHVAILSVHSASTIKAARAFLDFPLVILLFTLHQLQGQPVVLSFSFFLFIPSWLYAILPFCFHISWLIFLLTFLLISLLFMFGYLLFSVVIYSLLTFMHILLFSSLIFLGSLFPHISFPFYSSLSSVICFLRSFLLFFFFSGLFSDTFYFH